DVQVLADPEAVLDRAQVGPVVVRRRHHLAAGDARADGDEADAPAERSERARCSRARSEDAAAPLQVGEAVLVEGDEKQAAYAGRRERRRLQDLRYLGREPGVGRRETARLTGFGRDARSVVAVVAGVGRDERVVRG